jgi:hypothetical protein
MLSLITFTKQVNGTTITMSYDLESENPTVFDANTAETLDDIELFVDMVSERREEDFTNC